MTKVDLLKALDSIPWDAQITAIHLDHIATGESRASVTIWSDDVIHLDWKS